MLPIVLAFIAMIVIVRPYIAGFIEADRCLDRGGRYDAQKEICLTRPRSKMQAIHESSASTNSQ